MDTAQQGGQLVPVCLRLPQVEHLVFQEPQTSTPGKPRALGLIRSAGYQFLTAVADPGGAEPGKCAGVWQRALDRESCDPPALLPGSPASE